MSNAHEILSYTVSAEDKASVVFRGISAELTKLTTGGRNGLQGLNREFAALGNHKPLTFVKADQALAIAQTEAQMARLQKTTAATGVATKLQAAELGVLGNKHKTLQAELDKTAGKHHMATKAATVASTAIVGAGAAVVIGAVKQGIAFADLGKEIQQQTGLSEKSMASLMGTIRSSTAHAPFAMKEVADAAVLLKTRFGETNPEIEKNSLLMDAFAKRAGKEVTPAIQGLSNILHQYRRPLGEVVGLTDELTNVSQLTQQPLGAMEGTLERFGPKLQAMGFGMHESIRLMGILGASGVKAEQMGRGLSAAYGAAQKMLGGAAGPQAALDKQSQSVTRAQERLALLNLTVPKTVVEQQRHTIEVHRANEALSEAQSKYDAVKKSIDAAGGSHATVAGVIKNEITQIEHAKSQSEAFSIAASAFGKQVGPAFARAFYNNKTAVEATDKALGKHGSTLSLLDKEEKEFAGKAQMVRNQWHDIELTLSEHLIPALKTFLDLVSGGIGDIDKFAKGNASLAEALGGIALVGAGGFLARKPIGAVLKGASHLPGLGGLAKIPGVGGSSGIYGIRGAGQPGSLTNPIMVRMEGGGPGGSPVPVSTSEKVAGESVLAKAGGAISKVAKRGGEAALVIEALNIALPGNTSAKGLPTHGSGVGGQFKGWVHDSSEALTTGFGDLLGGKVGKALGDVFGHNRTDDLRSFGDQLKKLKGPLSDLPAGPMKKIHDEAIALGRDNSLAKWRPQLEAIAKATDPVQIALSKVGGSFSRLRFTVEKELGLLSTHIPGKIKPGTTAAATAFSLLTGVIRAEMQAGVRSTESGTAEIHKILSEQLSSLGLKAPSAKNQAFGPLPGGGANALQPTGVGESSGFGGLEGATGVRVPGRPGPDNWTLVDPAGRPAAKVAGAELLVANRHTERAASLATQMVYGKSLGQMVAGETTPHGMAKGGRVVTASEFGGHNDPSAFMHSTASGAIANDSLWGFAELSNPPGSLNFSALGHLPMGSMLDITYGGHTAKRVPKVDVGAGGPGLGGHLRAVDATYAVARALGLTGLADVTIFGAGQGPAGASAAGASSAHIKRVMAKGVHGVVRQLVQGTLDKQTHAANAYLAKRAPASATAVGGGGSVTAAGAAPTGGGFSPTALGTFDGLQVASWIVPELQFARKHGWPGHITSGLRLGFDPHAPSGSMHALDIYPGGAVDFGGMVDPAGLANRAAFISATAGYTGKKLLTPIGFRDDGHMSGTGHALGGRVNYAGAFGSGGSVTASSPTLAIFGENGTETAHFVPHAALGTSVSSSGLQTTPGVNPDTGSIEYHTQEEWAEIHRQHSSRTTKESLARKHHGKKGPKPTYEDTVSVGGMPAGLVTLTTHGGVSVPKDVAKLTSSVWTKVVAAIQKTLKDTTDIQVATSIVGKLAHEHPTDPKTKQRLASLTTKSIEAAAKSVQRVTQTAAPGDALGAGTTAITAIAKLEKDARASHNKGLLAGLRKDTEWAFKWASSTITRTASEAPVGQVASASSTAVGQLSRLLTKAQNEGRTQIQLGLLKDIQKTVAGWHQAIASSLSKQQEVQKAKVDLRVARQTLTEIQTSGAGTKIKAGSTRDAAWVKAEEAANNKAIKEMQKEQGVIAGLITREKGLIGKLNAKLHRELKHHHAAAAKVIRAEISSIQAALGEAQSQMEEVTANIEQTEAANANVAAEHLKAVYEEFKEGIEATTRTFESERNALGTADALEQGKLHREGKDLGALGEKKSEQEGVLTPDQIAQANSDLAASTKRHQEEINSDERQRSYDESMLPGLSGEDRANMVKSIEDLTRGINDLQNTVYDDTKSTKKLTEATNNAAKVYGGTVGFNFNGQDYTVGSSSMSSASGPDISVGI